jgi:hypothetical protein
MYLLMEYYRRQVSFTTDIIHAFAGIINAFDNSEYFHDRATHFYGIPIIYNNTELARATVSFKENLAWETVPSTANLIPTKRTDIFPTWSWASAKADQKEHTPRRLFQVPYRIADLRSPLSTAEVRVEHRVHGEMDISAFTIHDDGYEHFFPYINVTSWVLDCDVRADAGFVRILGEDILLEHAPACRPSKFYIVFIGVHGSSPTCGAIGILTQEVSPGVFCRVGLWQHQAKYPLAKKPSRVEDLLALMLDLEMERQLKETPEKELSPELKGRWQRRTLRII